MISKIIKFQVRTPLFLGTTICDDPDIVKQVRIGRQQKTLKFKVQTTNAELNINAFKGLLHWWFRAATCYTENLYKSEGRIFGSTKEAAKFKIKIFNTSLSKAEWKDNLRDTNFGFYYIINRNGERKRSYFNGLKYFSKNLYTESKNEQNPKISKREYFEPDKSTFQLKLSAESEDVLYKLLMLFWLAFQFGGIGSRSRRTFGNLKILSEEQITISGNIFSFQNTYKNISNFKNLVKNNLDIIRKEFSFAENKEDKNKIPCLKNERIYYSKPIYTARLTNSNVNSSEENLDWKAAINFAGVTMQFFRTLRENDHTNVHNFGKLSKIERAVFGLPLEFRFSRGGRPITINHYDSEGNAQRLASPIWVSITEIGNSYRVQYLILPYDYNSHPMNVKAEKEGAKINTQIVEKTVTKFEDFLIENPKTGIIDYPEYDPNKFEYKKLI